MIKVCHVETDTIELMFDIDNTIGIALKGSGGSVREENEIEVADLNPTQKEAVWKALGELKGCLTRLGETLIPV